MMGDCHVRFRERLGVKFPLPTRPPPLPLSVKYSAFQTFNREKNKIVIRLLLDYI